MKITLEQRKLLTEWLGEKYYDDIAPNEARWHIDKIIANRSFTCWQDFGVVVKKLGWKQAVDYIIPQIPSEINSEEVPERFCVLVAEAIKEGEIK